MENLVRHTVLEIRRVYVVGRAQARHADGVRPDPETGFQMLGMHQQTDEVVTVGLQPEQHADTHIVDTARHGTVHGLGVVSIVAFRSRRMK